MAIDYKSHLSHIWPVIPLFCAQRITGCKEFEHACDRVNVLREVKEWCSRCGGRLDPMTADMEEALCPTCRNRIDPFSKEFD